MKKETIIWQAIVLVLGLFLIFTIKTFFENKIITEAMSIHAETMAKRANCYLLAEEKNLDGSACDNVDTTAYRLFDDKYKSVK